MGDCYITRRGGGSSDVINGIIGEYRASGADISANTFVEFLNDYNNLISGTEAVFNAASTNYISAILIDSMHALVCYQDGGNSNYGTAVVLTVSGTSITTGTETVFNSGNTEDKNVVLIDSNHVLICYRDSDNSGYGTAIILTINGTTITIGTETVFNAASTSSISAVLLDSTHALVCYKDNGYGGYGTAQILTISGTTVTAGTEKFFNAGSTAYISVFVLDSAHAFVFYQDAGNNSYGTAVVLTISGTTITIGTETVFNAASTSSISAVLLDSTHALVCYKDEGNKNYGTAQMLTISSTTITIGTETVFNAGLTFTNQPILIDSNHVLVCYSDFVNNFYGTTIILTINGTTITVGTETVFNAANTTGISAVLIDSNHVLICYRDSDNSGTSVVLQVPKVIKASEFKIEGITKTKCTSTTTGKVWTL